MNTKIRIFSLFLLLSGFLAAIGAYAGQMVQVSSLGECTAEGDGVYVIT